MGDERLRAIGAGLRKLRKASGWSGRVLAERAGVAQSAVSRVENGQRVAGPDVIEQIISALPLDGEKAARLRSEVHAAYAATNERRIDAGFSLKRDAARKLERSAMSVRGFQSAMVPRPLRTAEYATAAGARDLGVSCGLDGAERDFRFVVTEGALRTWPGDGSVMSAQLAHLLSVAERPNVSLGVVPWSVPLPVVPPHGFTLYGSEAVVVETFTAELTITEPDAVACYADAFAELDRVAVVGDGMRSLLEAVRRDFSDLPHLIQ